MFFWLAIIAAPALEIADISFDLGTHRREAPGSDNWACTWADDGHLYTVWGDGGGFGGTNSDGRVSLGFGRVEGDPPSYRGLNLFGGKDGKRPARLTGKSWTMLALNETFYTWINPGGANGRPDDFGRSRLYRSRDRALSWQDTGQELDAHQHHGAFGTAHILNFGQNYGGARDGFVYTYWTGEKEIGFSSSDRIYLTRVPRAQIEDLSRYEYWTGAASWTRDVQKRRPVFENAKAVHWTFNIVFVAPLGNYVLITNLRENTGQKLDARSDVGFWQADEPWGPWTHVKTFEDWRPPGSTDGNRYTFFYEFPAKWISADGRRFTMVYTGKGPHDSWNTVAGTFTVRKRTP
jgi:hypothetical protein